MLGDFDIEVGVRNGEPRLMAKLNGWVLASLQPRKLHALYRTYQKVDLPASLRPPVVR